MKKIYLFLILIGYVLSINFISNYLISYNFNNNPAEATATGSDLNIGVSESISVDVTKSRFYGTIQESNGVSNVYILDWIPLPLKNKNFNFLYIHIPFLILWLYLFFKKPKIQNKKVYKSEEIDNGYGMVD